MPTDFSDPNQSLIYCKKMALIQMHKILHDDKIGIVDADDIAMEAVMALDVGLKSEEGVADPPSFVKATIRNLVIRYLRREKRRTAEALVEDCTPLVDDSLPKPAFWHELVDRAKRKLSLGDQPIFERLIEGVIASEEIATVLSKTEGSVRGSLARAKSALRFTWGNMRMERFFDLLDNPCADRLDPILEMARTRAEKPEFWLDAFIRMGGFFAAGVFGDEEVPKAMDRIMEGQPPITPIDDETKEEMLYVHLPFAYSVLTNPSLTIPADPYFQGTLRTMIPPLRFQLEPILPLNIPDAFAMAVHLVAGISSFAAIGMGDDPILQRTCAGLMPDFRRYLDHGDFNEAADIGRIESVGLPAWFLELWQT